MTEAEASRAYDQVAVGEFIGGPTIYVTRTLLAQVGEREVRERVRELLAAPYRRASRRATPGAEQS